MAPGRVHCRIGSSENEIGVEVATIAVHCRIGSSENRSTRREVMSNVHCRIGSSESAQKQALSGCEVHCRIGSSENARRWHKARLGVHCSIGSSENPMQAQPCRWHVHCRIGSSEKDDRGLASRRWVHCRIGSSENRPAARPVPRVPGAFRCRPCATFLQGRTCGGVDSSGYASASSTTCTQCFTGVWVPLCKCVMQPMLAEVMTLGASACRLSSLRSRSCVDSSGCNTE